LSEMMALVAGLAAIAPVFAMRAVAKMMCLNMVFSGRVIGVIKTTRLTLPVE